MRIVLVALLALAACSMEHDVTITVDIDDACLACVPACDGDGYSCETWEGEPCPGCFAGCIGGSAIACGADGEVVCSNTLGDEMPQVPSLCLSRDE